MSSASDASSVATAATQPVTPKRGALIVFEGLDRSGKTTQVARLVETLNAAGHKAHMQRFPDRTTAIGGMISSYLQNTTALDDHVIHLLYSANRWELIAGLRARLDAGETVVVDRYCYSGIAYTHFKGLDWDWCVQPDVGLPAPDRVFFLTVSDAVAARRGGFGEERYETTEIQRAVRRIYGDLQRTRAGRAWVTVDADGTQEEVAAALHDQALAVIADVAARAPPLQTLAADDFTRDFTHD
jgi:dTMP kinase